MDYSFTPFDPLVWLIFAAFALVTWLIVRAYLARYPDYPGRSEEEMK